MQDDISPMQDASHITHLACIKFLFLFFDVQSDLTLVISHSTQNFPMCLVYTEIPKFWAKTWFKLISYLYELPQKPGFKKK